MEPRAPHEIVTALLAGRHETVAILLDRLDPPSFAQWAARNGLSSVLFELSPDGGPLRPLLHDDRRHHVADELRRADWVGRLLDDLAARGVTVYGFKGSGVAHLPHLYARPDLRPVGDVDLLVAKDQVDDAVDVARAHGFAFKDDDPMVVEYLTHVHYNATMRHPRHGYLEIHNDLYRDIPSTSTAAMLARARAGTIYGRPVEILQDVDLFLLLSVHLGITEGDPLWIWLEDLRRLGEALGPDDWEVLYARAVAAGDQLFLCVALRCLETLWSIRPDTMPADYIARLHDAMGALERRAADEAVAGLPRLPGDRLSMARRLSGRPVRGRHGVWSSLFCHPGVVCNELGVRSDSPWFWIHRVRHVPHRAGRALRALLRR